MEIIKPRIIVDGPPSYEKMLSKIESAGRICYQSEPKGDPEKFIRGIINSGHTSVIEHEFLSFKIICSRGVTHELVRHRIASYSQESQRYVNYEKKNGVQFIDPIQFSKPTKESAILFNIWSEACLYSEQTYDHMIKLGAKPQEARLVLNNSCKTQIEMTLDLRSLQNFFKLRCSKDADAPMKEIAIPMLKYCQDKYPVFFSDIKYDTDFEKDYIPDWKTYISEHNYN